MGNSFNRDIITRQLREEARYDGVVCTDWLITHDEVHPGVHSGKPWGVERMTEAERHYKALMAGVDQFAGNDLKEPVLEAYRMGVAEHGEKWMRERMDHSARRLLLNMFRTGLFDTPYIDVEEAESTVGCPEFMEQGYRQQLASVVMLKNHAGVLPLAKNRRLRLFIPQRRSPEGPNYWRQIIPERIYDPVQRHIVERDFIVAEDAASADAAVVFIESPHSYLMGYDRADVERGGNGYIPISLQYADYTATDAREHSIAGGDPFEDFTDRSYRGKTAHTINRCDMELVQRTREAMGNRLLIVAINMLNPTVMSEIEPLADAILVGFDVQSQAIMDIVAGHYEPQGRLPFQLPASMSAVERHFEDRPLDIECYRDADGNVYDFAFGMGWGGVLPAPEL